MEEKNRLEPGLLRTYRLLLWVLVGISTIQAVSVYIRVGFATLRVHPFWVFPFGNLLTLGLLYWPWFRKKTEEFFIPLLVVVTTINSIVTTYSTSLLRSNPDVTISILVEASQNVTIPFEMQEFSLILASWQLIPLLFIPLIMVAWQYNFKGVLVYTVGSTVLDIIALLVILNVNESVISMISIMGVLVTRVLTFQVVGFLITRMMAAQRQQQRELRHANQRLLGYAMTLEQLTTSRERNRLARELHDTLAHTLSGLAVQLGAVKALWRHDENAATDKLDEAIDATRSGLNETRRALQALRAEPLENMGLGLAIEELARSAASRCGAALSLDIDEVPNGVTPDFSQAFYRAAQEGLENVVRYSETEQLSLSLSVIDGKLTLQIKDNGVGFDPANIRLNAFGLRGIKERAELLNGSFIIDSETGRGTTLIFSAEVPCHD
jgi:signal transduction histidine kinase